jgi:hypothetical protein
MMYRSNFNFIRVCMIYVVINVYYSVQDQYMTLLTRCVESMEFRVRCRWRNSIGVIIPNKIYLPSRSMFENNVLTYCIQPAIRDR